MFLHAWDLADDRTDEVMGWMREAALDTMCMAATYHSGWFLHPQSSRHRAFTAQSGVRYFHRGMSLFRGVRLVPELSTVANKKDWLDEAGKRLSKYGLKLVPWVIGVHNTRLGLAFPELTQQNVYGDRLPHALCPANNEVLEYLLNLCRAIVQNYPVWALQLEAFGWMGFAHGHHHERDLVGLTPLEQELMGLCFCPACRRKAGEAGVPITSAFMLVKSTLDAAFHEAPQRPKSHPRRMEDLEARSPELRKFNEWRRNFARSLVTAIKCDALKDTGCRLLLQTPFDPALADVVDGFACDAFRKSPAETRLICKEAKETVPRGWKGLFQCLIQLGMGVPKSENELRRIISAVCAGGCNGINFYNLSESPPKMLGWLAKNLPDFNP